MKVGLGFDIHRLAAGHPLRLGGVTIPHEKGSVGHSDGDCLFHAVADALLGAAGLGDIGTYFPDTDPRWKNADSSIFLKEVRRLLQEKKLKIENLDANVHLETPRLSPYRTKMVQNLSEALGLPAERINVKAKSGEGLDAVGCGEAVAAQAIVLLSYDT